MNQRIEQFHQTKPFIREKVPSKHAKFGEYPVNSVLEAVYNNPVKIPLSQFEDKGEKHGTARFIGLDRVKDRDQGRKFEENWKKFESEKYIPKLIPVPRDEEIGIKKISKEGDQQKRKIIKDGVLKLVNKRERPVEELEKGIDISKWIKGETEVKMMVGGSVERGKEGGGGRGPKEVKRETKGGVQGD